MKKKFFASIIILFVLFILLSLPCHGNLVCTGPATVYLDYPFLWILILIPLSLFALTLNNTQHKTWLKFTGIFFAISMILVFLSPEYDSGIISVDREIVNWFLAGLHSFISLVYFIVQFVKNRQKSI